MLYFFLKNLFGGQAPPGPAVGAGELTDAPLLYIKEGRAGE